MSGSGEALRCPLWTVVGWAPALAVRRSRASMDAPAAECSTKASTRVSTSAPASIATNLDLAGFVAGFVAGAGRPARSAIVVRRCGQVARVVVAVGEGAV